MHRLLIAAALAAILSACGGGGGSSPEPAPAPLPAPVVTLSAPAVAVLAGGGPVTLSATVSTNDNVSWSLAEGAPGSLAANGAAAQYTPPASIAAQTQVTITAKAGSTSRTLTLTVYPDPGAPGLTLIAGTLGDRALLDGTGDAARFRRITELSLAIDGGMLVADDFSRIRDFSALRKIDADRKVTTLLRTDYGHVDGDVGRARLGSIRSAAQTADGAIWFLDEFDNKTYLRRFANGVVSTVFDNSNPRFSRLYAAPGPRLYLTTEGGIWQMATNSATPVLLAGSTRNPELPLDGDGAAARFATINDLAIAPSGELVVADKCILRKVTPAGRVSTLAGQAQAPCAIVNGELDAARFENLRGVAVDATGLIRVLDQYTVRELSPAGTVSTVVTVPPPATQVGYDRQSYPHAIRLTAAGDVLLARDGEITRLAGTRLERYAGLEDDSAEEVDGVGAAARFMGPIYLSADRAGNIYVVDDNILTGGADSAHVGIRLRKIAPNGSVTTVFPFELTQERPTGIAHAPDGTLYMVVQAPEPNFFTFTGGGAIYKVAQDGTRTLIAGKLSCCVQEDGQGEAARFVDAFMAGIDDDGNIYVTDAGKFRKITPGGLVTTVAALPASLGKAPDGFRYKTDFKTSVLRINADGSETVVAGGGEVPATVLGALPGGLSRPKAIVPLGPYSFAVTSGSAILKLVLPH